MTPMGTIFKLFWEGHGGKWSTPVLALYRKKGDKFDKEWIGYHLWVASERLRMRRHFQVWPVNKRFLRTWE